MSRIKDTKKNNFELPSGEDFDDIFKELCNGYPMVTLRGVTTFWLGVTTKITTLNCYPTRFIQEWLAGYPLLIFYKNDAKSENGKIFGNFVYK